MNILIQMCNCNSYIVCSDTMKIKATNYVGIDICGIIQTEYLSITQTSFCWLYFFSHISNSTYFNKCFCPINFLIRYCCSSFQREGWVQKVNYTLSQWFYFHVLRYSEVLCVGLSEWSGALHLLALPWELERRGTCLIFAIVGTFNNKNETKKQYE